MAAAAAAVAVLGVPSDVADELLVFYFENRRRSGGGPVQSWRRRGGRATLTFERPEDAQRVLSRSDHALQGVQLTVQPAAPRDYGKVLLQGLNPQSSLELVELYVEHLLDCERDAYSIWRSPAGDQALVQLQVVLSHAGTCGALLHSERSQLSLLRGLPGPQVGLPPGALGLLLAHAPLLCPPPRETPAGADTQRAGNPLPCQTLQSCTKLHHVGCSFWLAGIVCPPGRILHYGQS
uniref:RRM domain-containing protein n=1 Tax=Pseudonaja textilis TaxID=8673 RepID=A0A670ZUJ4_PSETE